MTKDSAAVVNSQFQHDGWVSQRSQPSIPNEGRGGDTSTEAIQMERQ